MWTRTMLGSALGMALFLHAPAWAQTLGELSAAQGVGASVGAAGASSASTARAVRDTITSNLPSSTGSLPPSAFSSSSGKSAWAAASAREAGPGNAKGWASARSAGATGKGWATARTGGQAGAAKGWATAASGWSPAAHR